MRALRSSLFLILGLCVLSTAQVLAASPPLKSPSTGLSVSPAITQINLTPGQTSYTFNTEVTNNTTNSVLVAISAQDFTTLTENGSIDFLGNNYLASPAHGLASWIRIGYTQTALAPGSTQTVPITINNADKLAPGGHYASIDYQILTQGGQSNINTHEVVSSLVFLTTAGPTTQTIQLNAAPWKSLYVSIPSTFNVVFTNTGNTQTAPRGVATITNFSGKEIARGIVNTDSGLVLPSTIRLYNVPLRLENKVNWPGIYHLKLEYQAGSSGKALYYTKTFFVISEPVIIAAVIIILLAVVYLFRKWAPEDIYSRKS